MKTVKKQKQHYVDNQEFLAAIVKYKEKVYIAACYRIDVAEISSNSNLKELGVFQ